MDTEQWSEIHWIIENSILHGKAIKPIIWNFQFYKSITVENVDYFLHRQIKKIDFWKLSIFKLRNWSKHCLKLKSTVDSGDR